MNSYLKQLTFSCIILPFLSAITLSDLIAQQSVGNSADPYLETRGEVYFKFATDKKNINFLSRQISIDKIQGDTIFAYANRKEFSRFLEYDIQYEVLGPPSLQYHTDMALKAADLKEWDSYPGYTAYLEMMAAFEDNYPGLCKVHEIGTSIEGRKLLVAKISDNVANKESEPEFLFTSSIHGDELTGYILCLRLIDYLLQNYETDPLVKRLVDSVEIWINPLSNPDGTYAGGNNTVTGAMRYNANFVDLNRNYPDPEDGQHPDGESWQKENIAMMDFMEAHNFVFSANYHGGAEVLNYPWDTWFKRHPDDIWFQQVSLAYADSVKKYGGVGYFSDISDNGITNGYDWYTISGGRQDFMTYYCHGREITIEVSEIKLPPASSLPDYWNYNSAAMLHYIENCLYGIRGIVSDSATLEPICARLEVIGFDADSSQVYCDPYTGNYNRMIEPGSYDLKFSAHGYKNKVIENVIVSNYSSIHWLDVELARDPDQPDIPVSLITISSSGGLNTISEPAGMLQLYAEVLPSNATNKNVEWSVQNTTGQATVTSSGLVTAKTNGIVNVIASSTDESGVSGNYEITITNQPVFLNGNIAETLDAYIGSDRVLYLNSYDSGNMKIDIFSVSGEIIKSIKFYQPVGNNQIELMDEYLSQNLYICRISFNGTIRVIKFTSLHPGN